MFPRVTKLPDVGDKGVRSGREAGEMQSLAVCFTSNLDGDQWQTVSPAEQQVCFGCYCSLPLCHCNRNHSNKRAEAVNTTALTSSVWKPQRALSQPFFFFPFQSHLNINHFSLAPSIIN